MFFTYKSKEKKGERDIIVGVLSPSSRQIVYISNSVRPTNYFLSFKLSVPKETLKGHISGGH
jgi:hypothetical protein